MRLPVADAAALHAELFAEYPEPAAKKVSRLEREAKELANRSLTYGEIPFQTVDAIFQLVSAPSRDGGKKAAQRQLTKRAYNCGVASYATTLACCWTRAATSTTSARAVAKW